MKHNLAAAKEISMDAALAQLVGLFPFKKEERTELKAFLGCKYVLPPAGAG